MKKSANLFYFFLWAVSLAVSGVFFYSFSVLFLEDSGKSIFWMNCVVPFSALFSIIIFLVINCFLSIIAIVSSLRFIFRQFSINN